MSYSVAITTGRAAALHLALHAHGSPPTYSGFVDGAPCRVADYPYRVRWRLAAGEHIFQARLIGHALGFR